MPPVDEKKKVIEDVDKDRRYAIDAAIVRTMKSRKVMQHQQVNPLLSSDPSPLCMLTHIACPLAYSSGKVSALWSAA